jgi:hypothetical protein
MMRGKHSRVIADLRTHGGISSRFLMGRGVKATESDATSDRV